MTVPRLPEARPHWAERMRTERAVRGWSQAEAVALLQVHAKGRAASQETLLRNWKRWEAGTAKPDDFHRPLIALTFGTVTDAFFPPEPVAASDLVRATGMDTLEVVSRLRASDVSPTTLDAVRLSADQLCCEYPTRPPAELRAEAQVWLRRVTALLERRLTLKQHQDVLSIAGTVALLLGCLEYDLGDRPRAEATRLMAASLLGEAGDTAQLGWTFEMTAWFGNTQGDHRAAIAAAEAGGSVAPSTGAAVQLAAQAAKAWARLGDRRQVEVALDRGRALLESMPFPDNLDHHFVVDPAKFDFYAMDCYRVVGEHQLARVYADHVTRSSLGPAGEVRRPMRLAEAHITYGVIAAKSGDLEGAVGFGEKALNGDRRSLPSLVAASSELARVLTTRYPTERKTVAYVERLRSLGTPPARPSSGATAEGRSR